jgi:hypothetical protein
VTVRLSLPRGKRGECCETPQEVHNRPPTCLFCLGLISINYLVMTDGYSIWPAYEDRVRFTASMTFQFQFVSFALQMTNCLRSLRMGGVPFLTRTSNEPRAGIGPRWPSVQSAFVFDTDKSLLAGCGGGFRDAEQAQRDLWVENPCRYGFAASARDALPGVSRVQTSALAWSAPLAVEAVHGRGSFTASRRCIACW